VKFLISTSKQGSTFMDAPRTRSRTPTLHSQGACGRVGAPGSTRKPFHAHGATPHTKQEGKKDVTGTQAHRHIGTQAHRHTGTQAHRHSTDQIHGRMQQCSACIKAGLNFHGRTTHTVPPPQSCTLRKRGPVWEPQVPHAGRSMHTVLPQRQSKRGKKTSHAPRHSTDPNHRHM
jgi:hypothetical protein